MVRTLALVAQAALVVLIAYNAATSIWGWPHQRRAAAGSRATRFRVVVPAHNEERVIGSLLDDLGRMEYPTERSVVAVVADRCSDRTVSVARHFGVSIAERNDGQPGKGSTLQWYLDRHPLGPDEVVVVFDADNRVPPETLGRIADEMEAGQTVLQCYLDATNPDNSLLAEASALSYWAGNRMVQLARSNLGWSADLGGTGMAISARALAEAGGFASSLTEDQDLGVRLLLSGHRVGWAHDIRIRDEKPGSISVTVRQRARWMAGKRAARRRHLGRLIVHPTPAKLDMAIRLVQPGRSFVALLTAVLAVVAALVRTDWLFPWQLWAALAALQFLQPIPFLVREGVEPRRIVRYPLLALLAALWLPIRVASGGVKGWYHTPHVGVTSESEPDRGP